MSKMENLFNKEDERSCIHNSIKFNCDGTSVDIDNSDNSYVTNTTLSLLKMLKSEPKFNRVKILESFDNNGVILCKFLDGNVVIQTDFIIAWLSGFTIRYLNTDKKNGYKSQSTHLIVRLLDWNCNPCLDTTIPGGYRDYFDPSETMFISYDDMIEGMFKYVISQIQQLN